ncbi:metalloprotease PmbA [Orrella dioscoreae]|uniref:TldE protein, part of TldE/TldD proteolytic complex n=1 Tax=Orrella dioscoreae TaxID=1851544 RepID=A0A1C3JXB2_9BURK|nr:metalloprotease PmbA [Orrella dioscoreae]SBT23912.1 TldE protein, part of TldE/TldD proteolytic complex [Orrella dioscoreae]SOE47208.1 TldE protein, part of TldE/TldD proteolytic complex [Orrella dioscoreae]
MANAQHSLPIQANQARFRELVQQALDHARTLGASDAAAEVSESQGLAVTVRKKDVETVEQTRDRSLDVTVYAGQRRGSASTSDFSEAALRETVEAAWHIARYTAEDPVAGLPDADLLVQEPQDLSLHYPWTISAEEAARLALRAERAAADTDARITNTDGASVSTYEGHFVLGNTRGFLAGYPYSRHSLSAAPIAGRGAHMQRDYWYTSDRDASKLADPEAVGRYAAERALSRLSARRIKTGKFPVLFEAPLALGLLGALTQATSGGALYRKASFLVDALGKPVLADHLDVAEDPFVPGAMGSSPFDDEGVRTQARKVVEAGVLQGYFLSSYTARKLGMVSTGNAGGSHNLTLRSRLTRPDDDFRAMLRKLGTGFLVTELIGQGVNYVTGDYSRGAFGYWVVNGEIQHAVQEVTIAGNLAEMFRQIVAIGADEICRGTKCTGSILIERMAVAGA